MDILSFRFLNGRAAHFCAVFFLTLCATVIMPSVQAKGEAPYSAEEQVYLMKITPTLYEFSQLANEVSSSALTLQSAPSAECSGQFSYYTGLMGSFKNQLSGFTPPARFQSIHSQSIHAITDYETGLKLYGQACVEEDFGVKDSFVERGAGYINRSVESMQRVYADIRTVTRAKPAADATPQEERKTPRVQAMMETLSEPTVTEETETVVVDNTNDEKTADEIIREIEMKVKAKNEASTQEKAETPQREVETTVVSTPQTAPEETARALEAAAPETAEPEPPAIIVEKPVAEVLEVEPEAVSSPEKPTTETSLRQEKQPEETVVEPKTYNEETVVTVNEVAGGKTETPKDQISQEEKIARLNEKIMQSALSGENNGNADVAPETPVKEDFQTETSEDEKTAGGETVETVEESTAKETETPEDEVPQEEKIAKINEMIMQNASANENKGGENQAAAAETVIAKAGTPPETETVEKEATEEEVAVIAPQEQKEENQEPETTDEIKSWCMSRMSTESEQKICIKVRTEAKDTVENMVQKNPPGTEAGDIIQKCREDWKEGDTYNYEMVLSCTQFFCKQKGIEGCGGGSNQ